MTQAAHYSANNGPNNGPTYVNQTSVCTIKFPHKVCKMNLSAVINISLSLFLPTALVVDCVPFLLSQLPQTLWNF